MFLEALGAYASAYLEVGFPKDTLHLKFEAWLAFRTYATAYQAYLRCAFQTKDAL